MWVVGERIVKILILYDTNWCRWLPSPPGRPYRYCDLRLPSVPARGWEVTRPSSEQEEFKVTSTGPPEVWNLRDSKPPGPFRGGRGVFEPSRTRVTDQRGTTVTGKTKVSVPVSTCEVSGTPSVPVLPRDGKIQPTCPWGVHTHVDVG